MGKAEARPKGHGGGSGSGSSSPGKIFVGGLPRDTSDAMFVSHFGQYGEIVDSVIMKDKSTSQPRGFGFITYSNPAVVDKVIEDTHVINGKQIVDDLLANGNMIDLAGSKVEIKKAEPKKSSNPLQSSYSRSSRPAYDSDPPRDYPSADSYGGLPSVYCNYSSGGFDPYRSDGGSGDRLGMHGRMGGIGGGYGRYYAGLESYGGRPSFGYPSRFGPYGGGFDGAYVGGALSGYVGGGVTESFAGPGTSGFGNAVYGRPYDYALGDFGSSSTPDRSRGSFTGGSGRYHPYAR
ncbi:hypothetical protein PR202_ga21349 [Eleusine coracana subsp. coracana]|uniref:RRM domain-containing protein n=1 Tax=Eleusine coracana subsp. coracana TaxID=191504 RepID=A0AAV5D0A1_ELECO|nr:hypothetical protein PR202_ga21349 [Eleusine coracana subsp. coracana]